MRYAENKLTRQATITARLVPPNESCKILVSLLSRYGTRESFAFRALITFDKEKSDWLIAVLSSKRKPSFPVLRLFSLPAVWFQRMKNHGNLMIHKLWGSELRRTLFHRCYLIVFPWGIQLLQYTEIECEIEIEVRYTCEINEVKLSWQLCKGAAIFAVCHCDCENWMASTRHIIETSQSCATKCASFSKYCIEVLNVVHFHLCSE